MAIAALALWTLTVAFGVYLLITSTRVKPDVTEPAAAESAKEPVTVPAAAVKRQDRFDPPSLREAKSEPMPGMRALAEFMHPALAVTGLGFWAAYTLIRNDIFGVIGFGIMLGAIAAGLSLAGGNAHAARRGDEYALSFSPRVLLLHVTGAALTLLLAALIIARV